jgi:hypothetical protein
MKTRRPVVALAVAVVVSSALVAGPARGEDPSSSHQASKHFQHGVSLYGEADYRAALAEFKRAYALAPNPAVLYNVGETQYELEDYAGALATFERFLAETPPDDVHRPEVNGDLEVLRTRVGHMSIVTVPPGADLTVDDQPAGKTPLERPLLVSVGRRKVVAAIGGRAPTTRYVDVAAEDNLAVTVQLVDAAESAPFPGPRETPFHPLDTREASTSGRTLRVVGWTVTGALAAGAVTFGILAVTESHALETARRGFPASADTLNRDAQRTTTYSVLADSLTAAAVVVGGATLLSFWLSPSRSAGATGSSAMRMMLGPTSVRLQTTF